MGLLTLFCCLLALLQYRWIGEIMIAEKSRLIADLRSRLSGLNLRLNERISSAARAIVPSEQEIEKQGVQDAHASRFTAAPADTRAVFSRIALARPVNGNVELLMLDPEKSRFRSHEWPAEWSSMQNALKRRVAGLGPPPMETGLVFEIPRFRSNDRRGRQFGPLGEEDWLLLELNSQYVLKRLLPSLLDEYLDPAERTEYDVDVTDIPGDVTVYQSSPAHKRVRQADADATADLFDIRLSGPAERSPGPSGSARLPRGTARWRLFVRSRAGSVEALVARTRYRNLAISGGILLIIMAAGAMLVRISKKAATLAEGQVNFVAGVSHEFLTPVTVIRTAAYNLQNASFPKDPQQVARYGKLIDQEAEKVGALVAQVLQFASARAGHQTLNRGRVIVHDLLDDVISTRRAAMTDAGVVLETGVSPDLPLVYVDRRAMQNAIGNLLDNALKYGTRTESHPVQWIGVYAERDPDASDSRLQIRVVDRGPGIPEEEQRDIFEPFFRGSRAVAAQTRGTGLGLHLVKTIVEAHGGSVRVTSNPGTMTEFTVRIPIARMEPGA
jgi:signal transduction histidine kinase